MKIARDVLKKSVKSRITRIFIGSFSSVRNNTTVGTIRRATARHVMISRTKVSILAFEYRWTSLSSVLARCSGVEKSN